MSPVLRDYKRPSLLAFLTIALCIPLWSASWVVLGPDGGDARSLAYSPKDPDRILLGTSTGSIFLSTNGGRSWSRLAQLGSGAHYVIADILIDPVNPGIVFASAWSVEHRTSGDIFCSHDGGRSWAIIPAMHGKPVRSLAMSASNARILVAGALDGVYLTEDGGQEWRRISPDPDEGIKNIEAVAIDPRDPNLLYAGTWHLAWKTNDRGATWHRINKGMVDDSDVFSIIVDSKNPRVVFASACSGIYKSDNAGELFHKVQGIPFSARRTRVLRQDPGNPSVVYAGTTEGLWKTGDSGKTWKQLGSSEIVINDVLVDPRDSLRVLLVTDRAGILASDNGGLSFSPSNYGYTHRHITAILPDREDSQTLYVGVAGDREWGGVFRFREEQHSWTQSSAGLGGRDVLTLQQARDGTLVAGTTRGIFILDRHSKIWRASNEPGAHNPSPPLVRVKNTSTLTPGDSRALLMEAKINHLELSPSLWLAATSEGLFTSKDEGQSWQGGPVLGRKDFTLIRSRGLLQVLTTSTEILSSIDGGETWQMASLPSKLTSVRGMTIPVSGVDIFVVAREGIFRSSDAGKNWERVLNGLPERDLSSILYDTSRDLLLATSLDTGIVFESDDHGKTWTTGSDSGYPLLQVRVVNGRLFGATPFDGLVAEP